MGGRLKTLSFGDCSMKWKFSVLFFVAILFVACGKPQQTVSETFATNSTKVTDPATEAPGSMTVRLCRQCVGAFGAGCLDTGSTCSATKSGNTILVDAHCMPKSEGPMGATLLDHNGEEMFHITDFGDFRNSNIVSDDRYKEDDPYHESARFDNSAYILNDEARRQLEKNMRDHGYGEQGLSAKIGSTNRDEPVRIVGSGYTDVRLTGRPISEKALEELYDRHPNAEIRPEDYAGGALRFTDNNGLSLCSGSQSRCSRHRIARGFRRRCFPNGTRRHLGSDWSNQTGRLQRRSETVSKRNAGYGQQRLSTVFGTPPTARSYAGFLSFPRLTYLPLRGPPPPTGGGGL